MTPAFFHDFALVPALRLLPSQMDSPQARAMVVAICLQESRLERRVQIGGPARGYAQFELGGGVRGVLSHALTKPHIQTVLAALDYEPKSDATACYQAIAHNDILAAAFARLLLWTVPPALPERDETDAGWKQYLWAWRPGRPHPLTWRGNFDRAWMTIERS